ncbi:MAG: DUF5915 domain-containing protein, partial [Clostridia bacterium]|nr:DUF5915 domain-containing protein [Clostridia bacterium]
NRQPLQKLYIATDRKVKLSEGLYEIARDELNIKEFEILADASKFVSYKLKPQLKTLGPKYGKTLGAIRNFLDTRDATKVVQTVKAGETYSVELDGVKVDLTFDDLLISSESAEGFVSESANGLTVVLDAHITDELLVEGMMREIVSRVQTMRKEAGFEVTDRIELYYTADGLVKRVMSEKSNDVATGVLAEKVTEGRCADAYAKDFEIGEDKVSLAVKRIVK